MAEVKTNAMRLLDKEKIPYQTYSYNSSDGQIDGISVADKIGQPVESVFKTLVTIGNSKKYYVFVIPVIAELSLKAAARAVGEKSIAMIPVADIQKVTGYLRGGCSPIGMKKTYPTVIDSDGENLDSIIISAGKIGRQIALSPGKLAALVDAIFEKITE